MQRYDVIVLTAANEAQAEGYRAQMTWRKAQGMIDAQTAVHVITDPGGRVAVADSSLSLPKALKQRSGSVRR